MLFAPLQTFVMLYNVILMLYNAIVMLNNDITQQIPITKNKELFTVNPLQYLCLTTLKELAYINAYLYTALCLY